jgi:predicted phosphate transport protein (TIGR00153 family)
MSGELANVTQMLDEHFRIALSAHKILSNAVSMWLEEGKQVEEEDLQKIAGYEEKGDDLKRAILNELATATSLMQREDLLRLVYYNDKLIDGAEIACHHLAAVASDWKPSGELKDCIGKLVQLADEIIASQREAVRFLSLNIENSIAKTDDICRIEKEIDVLVRDIVSKLYPSDIPLATILRTRDFVNTIEEVSNWSEDAANTIRGLSLTLNT